MRYFDLHCDTLVECLSKGKSLLRNDLHVSVEKGARFAPYIQCAAVWLPDTVRGAEAFAYFERHADFLDRAAESGAFRLIRTGADVETLENARGVGLAEGPGGDEDAQGMVSDRRARCTSHTKSAVDWLLRGATA